LKFKEIANVENISNIVINVNGTDVFSGVVLGTPIVISARDTVKITTTRNELLTSKFTIFGELL
jgi:hypothetical protein